MANRQERGSSLRIVECNHPDSAAATYFRDALRDARAAALRDAEGFGAVVFAIERLGRYLYPAGRGLGDFRECITRLVESTPLCQSIAAAPGRLQTPFHELYEIVREGRNAALHEGAFARHLTSRTIELALFIEEALTNRMDKVGDFMIRGPVCASSWQPLSLVRHTMLANSFSYLPVWVAVEGRERWMLLSDHGLATYLRHTSEHAGRLERLGRSLETAIASRDLQLQEPFVCSGDFPIADALGASNGLPILVRGEREQDLIGIATAYDFL